MSKAVVLQLPAFKRESIVRKEKIMAMIKLSSRSKSFIECLTSVERQNVHVALSVQGNYTDLHGNKKLAVAQS